MTIKITTPNGGSDSLDFGCAQTAIVATVTGTEVSSGEGKLELKTTTGGTSATKATVLANGNVGIGATAPAELLHIYNSGGDAAVQIQGNTRSFKIEQNNYGLRWVDVSGGNAERMRIDAAGNLLIGQSTTTTPGAGNTTTGFSILPDGRFFSSMGGTFAQMNRNSDGYIVSFASSGNGVGNISINSSSTAYNTSSDYRLKENVQYEWDATSRLKQLKPARFNFIGEDKTVDGFIAHEAQEVVPEAVTGVKDEMADAVLYVKGDKLPKGKKIGDIKEKSKPVMQGIDQAKLVPLLVKTIQELEARIAKLEENK